MGKQNPKPLRKAIYTLVQSGTTGIGNNSQSGKKIVFGVGSEFVSKKVWENRAKRKTISQTLNLSLIKAAEKKGELERQRAYRNTFYCQNVLVSHDGRIYGQYCKNRSCTLCCSIRKAEIINRYLPIIKTWEDPFFVTLTVNSVRADGLKRRFFLLQRVFKRICEKYKKQNQRGKGQKLFGIKSIECNFNAAKQTYNPHLHLLVPNEMVANALIKDWLELWTKDFARPVGQHKRRVKNLEKDLVEVIKYGSKIFTDPDVKNKGKNPPHIYANALDNIFGAMKSRRIFDRFGFDLPKTEKESNVKIVPESQCQEWVFYLPNHDWKNPTTGNDLTGYTPTAQLQWLLTEKVDTDLE